MTILDEVKRLIEGTPTGGTIHAAIYSLNVPIIAEELKKAKSRGVTVKIAMDGSAPFKKSGWRKDTSEVMDLAIAINGHSPKGKKFEVDERITDMLKFCGDGKRGGNNGCITADSNGIMHTKFFTFSETTTPATTQNPNGQLLPKVVWFGSANMTYETGAESFNNAITIYGDTDLFDGFEKYFRHLFDEKPRTNDYHETRSGRGVWLGDMVHVDASPEQDSDLVLRQLKKILPNSDCRVHVEQNMIHDSRSDLITKLISLKAQGCKVRVVVKNIDKRSKERLQEKHIPVHEKKVHDKIILIKARFDDSPTPRHLVFTGSHNWTRKANNANDEILVRVESQTIYQAYREHFRKAY
ncbi:phospholipase D-like domain-containing protein [Sorangium sp. So ce124]|uniref:phospholipase D-like domain-containing protein n=1 Tax=Sorangium sp. So ce124 TaxID=3133280 RepID=UPI003F60AA7D